MPGNTPTPSSGISSANSDQYSLGLSATQNLFNGLKDKATLDQSASNLESARASLMAQKIKLHYDLKIAFVTLLYHQEQLALARKVEIRRKGDLDLISLRYQSGRENKGSLLKTKGQYHQAQYDIAQTERNLSVAQSQLARLLGRTERSPITLNGKLETPSLPASRPDYRSIVMRIPAYQQSEADYKSAQAGVTKALGEFLPSLSVTGSYSKTGEAFPLSNDRWSIGMNLSLPIFDGAANIFGLHAARADEAKAEVTFQAQKLQLMTQLEQAYNNLRGAVERVAVQDEILKAAEIRAEIARSQYNVGAITYNDWDIIESDLITQEQQLLSSRRDAVNAEGSWEQAQGKGDIK